MTNWTEEQYEAWKKKRNKTGTIGNPLLRAQDIDEIRKRAKSKNKFNAKKTTVDGITFDSKKEAERYETLTFAQKAGLIEDLKLQPKFLLQENFCKNGVAYQAIYYVADFQYYDTEKGKTIVEDVKSKATKTQVYRLKKKLFEYRYPDLEIVEV